MDTGFCAWLGEWSTPTVLMEGALSGAILETWVYGQLYRSFANRGIMPRLSYFRTGNGAEVDFLIEQDMHIPAGGKTQQPYPDRPERRALYPPPRQKHHQAGCCTVHSFGFSSLG